MSSSADWSDEVPSLKVGFSSYDINGIERLVESLKNHLINSELNEKRPLLKQLIKEAIE